ncbi:MAG TPA: PadR family transcriptional regulator [Bacteroidetes bacterium]|nr:PadR family transcriptional regulator [Bacteroidota bacterium]
MKVQSLLENTKQQMRKGILDLCILSIISEEGEAYPSDIIERLKESQMMVKQGTMYPLLARLKSAGLLEYRWQEYLGEDGKKGGPPRKYYSLTDQGTEFLGGLMGTWNQLYEAVNHSTKNTKAS